MVVLEEEEEEERRDRGGREEIILYHPSPYFIKALQQLPIDLGIKSKHGVKLQA